MPLCQIAKLLNAFTAQSCCSPLPRQPEEQAAQDNQCLDVIGTQMRNLRDKKDMEKENLFFFARFAAPVKPLFPLLESSHQKLARSVHHLGITVSFLGMLIKISYNSIQEKCCISPGSQGMSAAWLITSQPDCNAEDKALSTEDLWLVPSTVTLLLACVTAQTSLSALCAFCWLLGQCHVQFAVTVLGFTFLFK